jgi:hypothetical protein
VHEQFIGWIDADGDGYGEEGSSSVSFCGAMGSGFVNDSNDCDDSDAGKTQWVELLMNGDFSASERFETYPILGEDWGVEGCNADASELSRECDTAGNCFVVLAGDSTTTWSGDQLAHDIDLADLVDGDLIRMSFVALLVGSDPTVSEVYYDSVQFIEDASPWAYMSDRGSGVFFAEESVWTEYSVEDVYEAPSAYSGDGRFSIHFSVLTSGQELWVDDVGFEVCL